MTRVAIVGGGIAGLSAALDLVEASVEVVLFEAAGRLGGKLATSPLGGLAIDEGADAFLARRPEAIELAWRVGLGDALVSPAVGWASVFWDGRRHRMPEGLVLGVPAGWTGVKGLARSPLVGWRGAARAALEPVLSARRHRTGDIALGAEVRARFGNAVAERLVDPLLGGINAGDADGLSLAAASPQLSDAIDRSRSLLVGLARARAAANVPLEEPPRASKRATSADGGRLAAEVAPRGVRRGTETGDFAPASAAGAPISAAAEVAPGGAWEGTETGNFGPGHAPAHSAAPVFLTPVGGTGALATAVVERLRGTAELRVGHAVASIERAGAAGWLVDGEAFDAVVLAVPGWVAGPLLASVVPAAASVLADVPYSSVAMIGLVVPTAAFAADAHPAGSGVLVPKPQQRHVTAVSFGSNKWVHWRRLDGAQVLRVSVGRDGDEHALAYDDDTLRRAVLADLVDIIGLHGDPDEVRITRWPRSFPQYRPGHLDRIAAAEAAVRQGAPGLALAGAALRGVGIPACIASGRAAAASVMQHLMRVAA